MMAFLVEVGDVGAEEDEELEKDSEEEEGDEGAVVLGFSLGFPGLDENDRVRGPHVIHGHHWHWHRGHWHGLHPFVVVVVMLIVLVVVFVGVTESFFFFNSSVFFVDLLMGSAEERVFVWFVGREFGGMAVSVGLEEVLFTFLLEVVFSEGRDSFLGDEELDGLIGDKEKENDDENASRGRFQTGSNTTRRARRGRGTHRSVGGLWVSRTDSDTPAAMR